MEGGREAAEVTLVARKPCFGLPTACPNCLPVYIYLKLAQVPFQLVFDSTFPDSDQIPYFEYGTYVAYNNENGGVIETLKQDGIINLDSQFQSLPEYVSLNALIVSWLGEALIYELWIGTEGSSVWQMYFLDLPWVISKVLFQRQKCVIKTQLGITKENVEEREKQIYERASEAYGALLTRLGEQKFLFEDRPSCLDALFLAHVLFALQALPETSVLQSKLLEHNNLVRYAERLKSEFLEASSSSSSSSASATLHSFLSSSFSRKSSRPKNKPKREKTEEEKKFKRRARFFLAAQFTAIVLYLSVMGGPGSDELEFEDEE